MQAIYQIYAAVSYICIGDSESSTQVKVSCNYNSVGFICDCNLVFDCTRTFICFSIGLFPITE